MDTNKHLSTKIWKVIYPFLFYYAVMLIVMSITQWIVGSDSSHFVLCQLLTTLITIPFMLPFYRQDQIAVGYDGGSPRVTGERLICAGISIVIAVCIGIALNNIIAMSPLVDLSAGYQEASANFYGSTLVLELISSAFLTPILEELVFRGIIFGRLETMMPKPLAMILSSLIFAVMHFNIVQFIYALCLGIVLALIMDRAGHVYAAVVGHMAANCIAVLRTETGILAGTVKGNTFSWVFSIGLLTVGVLLCYYFYIFKRKR